MGKTEYYSLLNTMLLALGEFDQVKAVIEILAKTILLTHEKSHR